MLVLLRAQSECSRAAEDRLVAVLFQPIAEGFRGKDMAFAGAGNRNSRSVCLSSSLSHLLALTMAAASLGFETVRKPPQKNFEHVGERGRLFIIVVPLQEQLHEIQLVAG